jgi:MYXO-CTERM domain-containing protein
MGMAWRVPAPIVAVAATVSTWFTAFPYDSLWRGPLWPYVAGLALLPGVLAAGRLLLERTSAVRAGLPIAFAVAGVVALHPSIAFVLLVYVVALAVALVFKLEPVRWRGSFVPLLVAGVLSVLVVAPVILPARTASEGVQAAQWPEFASSPEGFGQVLLFSPVTTQPQWWLGLAGLAGLVLMVRRRRLLWLVGAYVVFGGAYAATASMNNYLVNLISGPFYNDAWRLAALLPLAGAFAVGEAVVALGTWAAPRIRLGRSWPAVVGVSAAALVVLALLGNGAYINRNSADVHMTYSDGPTVYAGEVAAYDWLAAHLKSGENVMNDRMDGSVWMYAMAGVQPMEWTFYGPQPGSVADKLNQDLNTMDRSPAVRRMLTEAHVRYVIVGRGYVRAGIQRAPGLQDLAHVAGLQQVYRTRDAIIYQVVANG